MRLSQRIIILVGCLLLCVILLFPPWLLSFNASPIANKRSAGYHLLFRPPAVDPNLKGQMYYSYELDTTRLEVEVLGILLVTLLLSLAFRKRKISTSTSTADAEPAVVDKNPPPE